MYAMNRVPDANRPVYTTFVTARRRSPASGLGDQVHVPLVRMPMSGGMPVRGFDGDDVERHVAHAARGLDGIREAPHRRARAFHDQGDELVIVKGASAAVRRFADAIQ